MTKTIFFTIAAGLGLGFVFQTRSENSNFTRNLQETVVASEVVGEKGRTKVKADPHPTAVSTGLAEFLELDQRLTELNIQSGLKLIVDLIKKQPIHEVEYFFRSWALRCVEAGLDPMAILQGSGVGTEIIMNFGNDVSEVLEYYDKEQEEPGNNIQSETDCLMLLLRSPEAFLERVTLFSDVDSDNLRNQVIVLAGVAAHAGNVSALFNRAATNPERLLFIQGLNDIGSIQALLKTSSTEFEGEVKDALLKRLAAFDPETSFQLLNNSSDAVRKNALGTDILQSLAGQGSSVTELQALAGQHAINVEPKQWEEIFIKLLENSPRMTEAERNELLGRAQSPGLLSALANGINDGEQACLESQTVNELDRNTYLENCANHLLTFSPYEASIVFAKLTRKPDSLLLERFLSELQNDPYAQKQWRHHFD